MVAAFEVVATLLVVAIEEELGPTNEVEDCNEVEVCNDVEGCKEVELCTEVEGRPDVDAASVVPGPVLSRAVLDEEAADELSIIVVPSSPRVSDTSVVVVGMSDATPVVVIIPVSVMSVGEALLIIVVVGTEMNVVGIVKVVWLVSKDSEVEVTADVGALLVTMVEVVAFRPKGSLARSASVGSSFNSGPISLPQFVHLRSLYPAHVGLVPDAQGRLPARPGRIASAKSAS